MFKRISLINSRGFLQKKENFNRGFLFSPLLIIPLFLVIISGLLIKSIQGDFLVSNYLGHILTGFLGYFLAFFVSYIPLERLKMYLVPFYLCTLISLLLIYFFGISVSGAQRWLNFGIFSFQPSEVAKLSTVLTLALVLDKKIIYTIKRFNFALISSSYSLVIGFLSAGLRYFFSFNCFDRCDALLVANAHRVDFVISILSCHFYIVFDLTKSSCFLDSIYRISCL